MTPLPRTPANDTVGVVGKVLLLDPDRRGACRRTARRGTARRRGTVRRGAARAADLLEGVPRVGLGRKSEAAVTEVVVLPREATVPDPHERELVAAVTLDVRVNLHGLFPNLASGRRYAAGHLGN